MKSYYNRIKFEYTKEPNECLTQCAISIIDASDFRKGEINFREGPYLKQIWPNMQKQIIRTEK